MGRGRGHGRVARKLVGFTMDSDAPPPDPGAAVQADGREVGQVTSAAWSPAIGRAIALGYVQRDFVAAGTPVAIGSARATVAALPFVPRV